MAKIPEVRWTWKVWERRREYYSVIHHQGKKRYIPLLFFSWNCWNCTKKKEHLMAFCNILLPPNICRHRECTWQRAQHLYSPFGFSEMFSWGNEYMTEDMGQYLWKERNFLRFRGPWRVVVFGWRPSSHAHRLTDTVCLRSRLPRTGVVGGRRN